MGTRFSTRRVWIEELDITVRSIWEGNICFLLEFMRKRGDVSMWAYEPEAFRFVEFGYKTGPFFYRPDFLVVLTDGELSEYWEVKGRELPGDRTRMKRFDKHYPEEAGKLRIIDGAAYKDLETMWSRAVPGWGGIWSTEPKKKPKPKKKGRPKRKGTK